MKIIAKRKPDPDPHNYTHIQTTAGTHKNTLIHQSISNLHLYKCRKQKRSHESVTAFQRALVLIVSLKQLFSSHSVPTSHSQLLAACTHMYIHPHGHFICGGNGHSFFLSPSLVVNVSFSLSDRYSAHLKCLGLMNVGQKKGLL